jgi:hypothetical protein
LLYRAAQLEALPENWRNYFQEQIRRQDARLDGWIALKNEPLKHEQGDNS